MTGDGAFHEPPGAGNGRVRPVVLAAVTLVLFVVTVIVLAVQAGTDTAMLTTLFAIVVAGIACGLWGTAMAIRETHGEHPALDAPAPNQGPSRLGEPSAQPTR